MIYNKMLHGGDYNPEQWLDHPEILKTDIEYFKKAQINEVTIGIFSWAKLEPEEGSFDFTWLGEIIDSMYENGISVILSTPSAARPKWMADRYPEVLRVDEYGHRDYFGARHNHCYTSPVYREKVRNINRMLSEKFGQHPAVIAWHISNEYGGAPHDCYCPLCQEEFRSFLKKRYGTIEALNKAWATTFWSHIYQSFDQVEAPSRRGECGLHGLNIDWRRFVTDRTIDFCKAEIEAIREGGSTLPATTNLMGGFLPLNYHKLAEVIDIVSWDNYPEWHKKEERATAAEAAFQHDLMRSLKREPFLLMESCPSATNWQPVSKLRRPGMMLTGSLQAVAHGSDSVQYFQLRQSQGSSEKFHGAVIDHYGGCDTRVFQEVTEVGESLEALREVTGSNTVSQIAILYDHESRWAMYDAQGPRNSGLMHDEAVLKAYQSYRRLGLNVDLIDMSQSIDRYKIVVVPMLYMFREGFEERLKAFVQQGGTAIMTYWSGIVDDTDLCFLGGTPHGLMDVFGLRSMEIDGLYDWEENAGRTEKPFLAGDHYICKTLCDLVKVSTAEVLMTYEDDFYAGYPALTVNTFGKGKAYYVCADFEERFYDDLAAAVTGERKVEGILSGLLPEIPQGIEVTSRENDTAEYIFIQNYSKEAVALDFKEDKLAALNIKRLLGQEGASMAPLTTIVLKKQK